MAAKTHQRQTRLRSLHEVMFSLDLGFAIALTVTLSLLGRRIGLVHGRPEVRDKFLETLIGINTHFHLHPLDWLGMDVILTAFTLAFFVLVFLLVPVKTKAGFRDVPLDPQAIQLLRDYLNGRTTGRVFQTSRGTPLVNGTVNVEHLRPLLVRLNIPHGTLHSFRHARVSHLRRLGVPDPLIKKWVGHSSLRMTDVYTHFDAEYEQQIAAECGLLVPKVPISPNAKHKQVA